MNKCIVFALLGALAFAGCKTGYTWTSKVPSDMRTVAVPTFRNETKVTEIGAVASRQLLRELQREGTFKIRRTGDAAIEIQGEITSASLGGGVHDRRTYNRVSSAEFNIRAKVSVIDKRNGRVLVNNKTYSASVTTSRIDDAMTAERDASARAADALAQQIVDDLLMRNW